LDGLALSNPTVQSIQILFSGEEFCVFKIKFVETVRQANCHRLRREGERPASHHGGRAFVAKEKNALGVGANRLICEG
jgi:hypothetical protein